MVDRERLAEEVEVDMEERKDTVGAVEEEGMEILSLLPLEGEELLMLTPRRSLTTEHKVPLDMALPEMARVDTLADTQEDTQEDTPVVMLVDTQVVMGADTEAAMAVDMEEQGTAQEGTAHQETQARQASDPQAHLPLPAPPASVHPLPQVQEVSAPLLLLALVSVLVLPPLELQASSAPGGPAARRSGLLVALLLVALLLVVSVLAVSVREVLRLEEEQLLEVGSSPPPLVPLPPLPLSVQERVSRSSARRTRSEGNRNSLIVSNRRRTSCPAKAPTPRLASRIMEMKIPSSLVALVLRDMERRLSLGME